MLEPRLDDAGVHARHIRLIRILAAGIALGLVPWLVTRAARFYLLDWWLDHAWLDQAVYKTLMGAATVLALHLSRMSFKDAGFCKPRERVRWGRLVAATAGVSLLWSVAFQRLYLPGSDVLQAFSFREALFWGDIYAPIIEESLFRGWFQTALSRVLPPKKDGNDADWEVLLSATLFGVMHLISVLRGAPISGALVTVASSTILGWFAARWRKRSGSVLPAIAIHITYNVTGQMLYGLALWAYEQKMSGR